MGILSPSDWTNAMSSDPTGSKEATALQRQMFDYQKEIMAPFVSSGQANVQRLNQMMVPGEYLDPTRTFTTQAWQASPEYSAYNAAQQAAQTDALANLQAQAGASGMYGGGTYANQLAQNLGNLYAQYQPASLAAAQQNWQANRRQAYNMLAGLANPTAAQQIGEWAGAVGRGAGQAAMNTAAARQQGMSGLGAGLADIGRGAWNYFNQPSAPYTASGDLSNLSGTMDTGFGYMDTGAGSAVSASAGADFGLESFW